MKPAEELVMEYQAKPKLGFVAKEELIEFAKFIQLDAGAHPDGEQPITEATLLDMGFVKSIEGGRRFTNGRLQIEIGANPSCWVVVGRGMYLETKKQLRQLASLLGITLNEQSK